MARRIKSDFVLAFKIKGTVFEKIVNAVWDAGGSDEHLRRLETDELLLADIATVIIGTGTVVPAPARNVYVSPGGFPVSVAR